MQLKMKLISAGTVGGVAAAAAAVALVATGTFGTAGDNAVRAVSHPTVHTASFQSPIRNSDATLEQKLTEYANGVEATSTTTTDEFLDLAHVTASTATQSGQRLDVASAQAQETDNGSYILRVPFAAAPNVLTISGYTVMFNPDRTIAARGEVIYQQQTEHSGRVALWQDGKKLTDQVVTDQTAQAGTGTTERAFSWDKLNKCLLNAGIAQWAITAIGVGCALLCGATVGAGCIACVIATGGVLGTTAGTCVGQAMAS